MKIIARLLATLMLIVSVALSAVSCDYTFDITERAKTYLAKAYPGKTFDIIDYEKHSNTSGRYEVTVRCRDDGVKFCMYIYSSIAVTDSYSVERANYVMNDVISEEVGGDIIENIDDVLWHSIYADKAENYSFREIDVNKSFALCDLDSIYEVKLASKLKENEIGEVIYDFIYALCDEYSDDCSIENVVFKYKIGRTSYKFTTCSKSVMNLGKDGVVHFVLSNITDHSSVKEVDMKYFS